MWILLVLLYGILKGVRKYGMEGSRITVMTLIKQSGSLVTILAGKFIFKEKNIAYKLICAGIIIIGIVIGVL